ncbi:hypothetical protein QU38_02000, partial [Staphylococcus aureus]
EEQVELFLHAERPAVGEGIIGGLRAEIAVGVGRQHDVAEPEKGESADLGEAVAQPGVGDEELRGQQGGEQHRDQRRHDPHQAARMDPPGELLEAGERAAEQRAGHHEAGDDEEDVHAGEAARQCPGPEVEEDHRGDGDGAQPVDRRNIAGAVPRS